MRTIDARASITTMRIALAGMIVMGMMPMVTFIPMRIPIPMRPTLPPICRSRRAFR